MRYCPNCGTEFEGNLCPTCKKPMQPSTPNDSNAALEEQNNPDKAPSPPTSDLSTSPPRKKEGLSKRAIFEIAGVALLLFFMISSLDRVSKADYNKLLKEYDSLNEEYKTKLAQEAENLEKVEKEYSEYKARMRPYEALDEAEAEARKIEADRVVAEQKAAEEQAAAEAAAAKAAEEAKGYETGVTYDQLARTPDDFKGQKVKFYGKVIQVMETDSSVQIRLANRISFIKVSHQLNTLWFNNFLAHKVITSLII